MIAALLPPLFAVSFPISGLTLALDLNGVLGAEDAVVVGQALLCGPIAHERVLWALRRRPEPTFPPDSDFPRDSAPEGLR